MARFFNTLDRYRHRQELIPLLQERFRQEKTEWWLTQLRGTVPCAPVNTVEEALNDEQVLARELLVEVEHPEFGPMRQTASAVRFPGPQRERSPASSLGADTATILSEYLNMPSDKIDDLRERGVI